MKACSSHADSDGLRGFVYRRDQCRSMPFRRLEISFSQGAEWKALIWKYITAIVSKEAPWCVTEQSKSAWPTLRAAVSSAMIKKVGEAARASNRTATALMLSGIIKMVFVMLWLFAISRRSLNRRIRRFFLQGTVVSDGRPRPPTHSSRGSRSRRVPCSPT
jgi:hypothetical protein